MDSSRQGTLQTPSEMTIWQDGVGIGQRRLSNQPHIGWLK